LLVRLSGETTVQITFVRRLAATCAIALGLLVSLFGFTTQDAQANDTCEGCVIIVDDVDCDSPTGHNWKLCGDDGVQGNTLEAVSTDGGIRSGGGRNNDGADNNTSEDEDEKHNWK
jgi:hypothetical protein